jgi:hypothetical protein
VSKIKQKQPYFVNELSFYSKEHGGTYHFLQFNVLYSEDFLNSPELKHFLKFVRKNYPDIKREEHKKYWEAFIENLQIRNSIL